MSSWKLAVTLTAGLAVVVATAVLGFTEPRLASAAVATAVVGVAGTLLLYGRQQQRQLPQLERRIVQRIEHLEQHVGQRIEHLEQHVGERIEHLEQRLEGRADEHVQILDAIAAVRVECNSVEVLQALDNLRTQVVDALNAAGEDESDRLITAFDLLTARIARLEHALDERPAGLHHPVP